jgi:alpha-beta hydrolase superfamily lysophospholipase
MAEQHTLQGSEGEIAYRVWPHEDPTRVVILAHGYGEHMGRYDHVAAALGERGAVVAGPDHIGHGRSEGERVLVSDYEHVIDDLDAVLDAVTADHPDLPVVLVGHSMGGLIAARYAQRHGDRLTALVLSAPVLGSWVQATDLLGMQEIPDVPLDPDTLSRDPEVGEAYAADELVWHGPFKRTTLESLAAALETVNGAPPLGELPALWVHGEADQLVPIEPSRAGVEALGLTNLHSKSYPGARHEVFNETNRDEVIAEVADFIDEMVGRD